MKYILFGLIIVFLIICLLFIYSALVIAHETDKVYENVENK